ncbi:hypothetical protein LR48_Vigan10g133300 [Vigna angularis]|uniref:Uncharacterized protein n=1 Tax=Phaseolus angularis TaxID=3914 RepID=A0A0L9VK86_PHAAN|nr:hypothetical protein LR48_Vigan10g133300 [Vigna angularis]
MADSRRNRRRTTGASSSRSRNVRPASIEGWISDEEKHDLFRAQGLTHLVEQKGCIYPDLIYVLYINLRYRDVIITTKVKGVPIILDDDVWTNVAQLTIWDDVVKVHLGVPDFNRLLAFQSFLHHPEQQINRRQLLVGGFKVEERMIHYLIVWLLCPRATNHAQCSEQDLLLLYGILNHIHIDWPTLISDTMVKAKKYNSYHFPYTLLISRILEYKGVSVEGELTHAIQAATLADAGPSQMPSSSSLTMEEHFANLSKQLEDMRLFQQTHFEQIYEWQQNHEEFVIDQFNDLDTRLGNIENHFNLQPPVKTPSPEF